MINKKILVLCYVLVCIVTSLLSQTVHYQQDKLDSVALIVNQLCDSCWGYRFESPEKAKRFGEKALIMADEYGYEKGIAQSYNDLGILLIDEANYVQAIQYFEYALKIREKLHDSAGMAALFNKMGIVYQKQGKLGEALSKQLLALAIYESTNNRAYQAICLNNIAIIHQNLGDLERSLDYHQQALNLRVELEDSKGEGTSYLNMANVFLKLSDTVSAIDYYDKALSIFQHFNDDEAYSAALNNLGKVYLAQKQYAIALPYLEKAMNLRLKAEDKKALSSTYAKLGEAYLGINKMVLSKEMLIKSLALAKEVGVVEEEMETVGLLADLYSKTNRFDSAYFYGKAYRALRDSVYTHRLDQQIVEVQARYDTQRQKSENELLLRENELFESQLTQRKTEIWLLVSILISFTGAGVFFYYRYRQRQRDLHNQALLKQNEIRMQAVIDAQESERRRIARDLHDGVGQKLSGIRLQWESMKMQSDNPVWDEHLVFMSKLLDETVQEVRSISHQMMPKELEQFGLIPAIEQTLLKSFEFSDMVYEFEHLGMEGRVPHVIELALFRILQELISNIIKHSQATRVTVQVINNKRNLVMVVEDDGVGVEHSPEKPSGKAGIGMMNVESRVEANKGHLHIESKDGKGMTITIRIPLI